MCIRIILFNIACFENFYPRIIKTHTISSLRFQVSKMGLTTFLALPAYILRAKLQKVVVRGKKCFLILGYFFQNEHFWGCGIFFSPSDYSIYSFFQWRCVLVRFMFLMKHFYALTIRIPMATKLFRVVKCCEELPPINMHEWPCGVTWQIKYMYLPAENVWTPN